jgi:hypothetical protein
MKKTPEERDKAARRNTMRGWTTWGLTVREEVAIVEFMDGGPCPEEYREIYNICRQHMHLPKLEE